MVQKVAKLYLFISDNIDKYKKYQNSKDFFEKFNTLISNTEENYNKQLTNSFKLFIYNIYSKLINIQFFMFKMTPKFLPPEIINNRKKNIKNITKRCIENNEKAVQDFKSNINQGVLNLKNYCGKKEFKEKLKLFDKNTNQKREKLNDILTQNSKDFNDQCFLEINKIYTYIYGDSYKLFTKDLNDVIKKDKRIEIATGTFGGAILGGCIVSLILTSAVVLPVIGIVAGGLTLTDF